MRSRVGRMPRRAAARRGFFLVFLAALTVTTPGVAAADDDTASIEIVNQTRWAIYELYLAPTQALDWGPDQLGDETIGPGDHFTLSDIPCQTYDMRLVDEDDDECVIAGLELCGESEWVIENEALLDCQQR